MASQLKADRTRRALDELNGEHSPIGQPAEAGALPPPGSHLRHLEHDLRKTDIRFQENNQLKQ
jgi:hypothetical protein